MKINVARLKNSLIDIQKVLSIEWVKSDGTTIRIIPLKSGIKIMKVNSPDDQLMVLPMSSNMIAIK